MKVAKFGGSSVSNATQIKKVLNIVNDDPDRKIIIVSAPGKRHKNDVKTTDLLIRLYEKVINQLDYQDKKRDYSTLCRYFRRITYGVYTLRNNR